MNHWWWYIMMLPSRLRRSRVKSTFISVLQVNQINQWRNQSMNKQRLVWSYLICLFFYQFIKMKQWHFGQAADEMKEWLTPWDCSNQQMCCDKCATLQVLLNFFLNSISLSHLRYETKITSRFGEAVQGTELIPIIRSLFRWWIFVPVSKWHEEKVE